VYIFIHHPIWGRFILHRSIYIPYILIWNSVVAGQLACSTSLCPLITCFRRSRRSTECYSAKNDLPAMTGVTYWLQLYCRMATNCMLAATLFNNRIQLVCGQIILAVQPAVLFKPPGRDGYDHDQEQRDAASEGVDYVLSKIHVFQNIWNSLIEFILIHVSRRFSISSSISRTPSMYTA
jgi:hypothetical protein